MPQDGVRKKVGHGETAQKAGRDAYPCLLVDLYVVDVEGWGQKRARDSTPFSHPVSAYLSQPATFKFTIRSEKCFSVSRKGMGATYKGPSNLSIPPKACPYSQTVHPLDTMFRVVCTHDRGRRHERLHIGVWRRNQTTGETGDSRKVTTVSEDKKARPTSPRQGDHTT
jgi:hypothetical protein